MSVMTQAGSLASFASISLDELVEKAALQTRIDRKYIVPRSALESVFSTVEDDARVLEIGGIRSFAYESIYFDTPNLDSYWLAAKDRRRRFKIRTRSYLDSGDCYLEVKTKGARSATVKERLEYDFAERARLTPAGREYADAVLAEAGIVGIETESLAPTLTTRYDRTTLFLPTSQSRATIDTDLTWILGDVEERDRPDMAIVETKSGSRASGVDRALWANGYRPVSISKYATGLAMMRSDLRSNKWAPVLRRHFAGAPNTTRTRTPHAHH